jgi:hypothetical protein
MVPRGWIFGGRRSNAQGSALVALTNITAGTAIEPHNHLNSQPLSASYRGALAEPRRHTLVE